MSRLIFAVFAALTAGACYLTVYGIGAESIDVARSVRAGSAGNTSSRSIK